MRQISTTKAPKAVGPYSQAIVCNDLLYTSGQIPLNADGNLIKGDIKEQTKQVMQNLQAILEEANSSFGKVIKTTIFLRDIEDFSKVNEVYSSYFDEILPARSTIEVSNLPLNAMVEIELIAKI